MIEIEFNDEQKKIEEEFRAELRRALKELTIEIEYEDIYNKKFTEKRNCDWFKNYSKINSTRN